MASRTLTPADKKALHNWYTWLTDGTLTNDEQYHVLYSIGQTKEVRDTVVFSALFPMSIPQQRIQLISARDTQTINTQFNQAFTQPIDKERIENVLACLDALVSSVTDSVGAVPAEAQVAVASLHAWLGWWMLPSAPDREQAIIDILDHALSAVRIAEEEQCDKSLIVLALLVIEGAERDTSPREMYRKIHD